MTIHRGALPPGLPHGDIEDCEDFGVWWYTQPARTGDVRLWAVAPKMSPNVFRVGSARSGFTDRDAAVAAGRILFAPLGQRS